MSDQTNDSRLPTELSFSEALAVYKARFRLILAHSLVSSFVWFTALVILSMLTNVSSFHSSSASSIPHGGFAELFQQAGSVLGTILLIGIIYAESGLLIGFFLPGNSLLFTAGFLASTGFFSLPVLMIGCFLATVIGGSTGYLFGRRVGRRLFKRDDSLFFHEKNLLRARSFYDHYGSKTIVLARFIPVVRTLAPIGAGIGDMHYRTFVTYNVVGGLLWSGGMLLAGNFLGHAIPDIDKYLLPIVALLSFISALSPVWHILRDAKLRTSLINTAFKLLNRSASRSKPSSFRDELP